jgi:hypothetical protein
MYWIKKRKGDHDYMHKNKHLPKWKNNSYKTQLSNNSMFKKIEKK